MLAYAERAQAATAVEATPLTLAVPARVETNARPLVRERPGPDGRRMPRLAGVEPALGERSTRDGEVMGWRDLAQSFAQDAAEMPVVSRLLAGQVVLALGYASLRGALALRERSYSGPVPAVLLAGLAAGGGIASVWAALALVSRTRAAPAITAFFAYGQALRQYLPPRLPRLPRNAAT